MVGLSHQRIATISTQLPGHLTPQCMNAAGSTGNRLVWGRIDAIQNGDTSRHQLGYFGLIENFANACHLAGWHLALGQVIDRQHGVRFAATECCLQLNHRITAIASKALDH
ncbi:hypothetical protein D3C77_174750 [compost metagenome]